MPRAPGRWAFGLALPACLAILVVVPVARAAFSVAFTSTPTFTATLNGTDQTATYTIPLTVTDTRGTGAGWNLTITSTQLSTGGTTPKTLATTASTITAVTSACQTGPCVNPTNSVAYPLTIPAAPTAPAAVKFANAALLTGMGTFTTTATAKVSVPANSYAGTYKSTLTISIVSGP